MKKIVQVYLSVLLFLFCFLITSVVQCAPEAQDVPVVKVFFSPHCKSCLVAIHDVIRPLSEKYGAQVEWQYYELTIPKNYSIFLDLEKKTGKKLGSPTVVVGKRVMLGLSEVSDSLEKEIIRALQLKPQTIVLNSSTLAILERFKTLRSLTVVTAGFVDGFNPCAFAVIVFFISFLTLMGYRRREMILIGVVYIATVFATYVLLGFGFFTALYQFRYFYSFSRFMYILIGVLSLVLGYFAVRDYIIFKKSGKTRDLALQLPKAIKKKIQAIVGHYYRREDRNQRKALFGLVLSALIVGFTVSLLEAVCTGQLYLPVIIFVLKEGALRTRAIYYLFLYNLMFILPLVIVFVLALVGVSSRHFESWVKKNLGAIKLAMAAVFFALGLVLLSGLY